MFLRRFQDKGIQALQISLSEMASEEDIAWLNSTFRPIPRPALPDDCIQYTLHVIDATIDRNDISEVRNLLKAVQKYAGTLQRQWTSGYIWQRDSFNLELVKENGEVCMPFCRTARMNLTSCAGLSFLQGRTEYGDSIEDEWVVVWLLREITKKYDSVWVKVTDADGEFLLIEASATLPQWLEPEVADNRVWINHGQLKIIKPAKSSKKNTEEKLTLEEAYSVILAQTSRIMHSTIIEEEAFYRLRNYPAQINDNMHHALIQIPRKIAYLLQQKESYVSPAVEAFYLRDPVSLKVLQKDHGDQLVFPPSDLIESSVKFPKVTYAQLKSQDIGILAAWKSRLASATEATERARLEVGMRLTCGFEMLLSDSQYQDRPAVQEMKLLLEDLDSGDAKLPSSEELEKRGMRQDDEKWLDIDFEDFQNDLDPSKNKGTPSRDRKPAFGDPTAQENLQRIVKQFESFMNEHGDRDAEDMFGEGDSDTDELGSDDDLDDDEEEDRNASFDEDEFTKIMTEMMGMPAEVMDEIRRGNIDALSNGTSPPGLPEESSSHRDVLKRTVADPVEELSSDEDEDIAELSKRIGEELRATGVLELDEDEEDAPPDFDQSFTRNLARGLNARDRIAVSATGGNTSRDKEKAAPKR